jgi:hypothetical protein
MPHNTPAPPGSIRSLAIGGFVLGVITIVALFLIYR